ncbi:MAG: CapA family protein, partial [Candidatus Omnitrophica bacterium]|nr:CapA family protein [Candidatus Omnitrophota bacterium]
MIRILIGGDVCPMGRVQNAFIKGDADEIFHDLLEEITDADLSIVNLESPLVSKKTPIEKAGGIVLGASIKCINGFT